MMQTIQARISKVNTLLYYTFPNNAKMEFREWLRVEMEKRDMGQSDLSRLCKVPQPTIHRILSGETPDPRGSTMAKIKRVLGEPPKPLTEPDEPSEISTLWALLIPSERDELLGQIRRRAAHNKAVMSLMKGGQIAEIPKPLGGRSFVNKHEISNELNERRLSAARERRQQAREVEIERRIKNRREDD